MGEDFRRGGNPALVSLLCTSACRNWEGHAASRHFPPEERVFLLIFPGNKQNRSQASKERIFNMERIRIVIADDHPVFRYGLRTLLQGEPQFEVVGEATTGQEAVELA